MDLPLCSIAQLGEESGGRTLRLGAKDGRLLRFGFGSSSARRALQARILEAHRPPYFERRRGQAPDSFDPAAADFERQKVPWRLWRLCDANASHSICGSYPASNLVVPAALSDDDVREAAQFRTRQRLPCLVYYDRWTGASLCRASQPLVGVVSHRNRKVRSTLSNIVQDAELDLLTMTAQDENLLRAIYDNNTNGTELRIVDCRSRMAALGNQLALGAGVESRQNGYETCQIEHQVRWR